MKLVNATKRYVNAADNVKSICGKQPVSTVLDMSPEGFELLKAALELVNASTDLIQEQTNMVDQIDQKLNKLLEIHS